MDVVDEAFRSPKTDRLLASNVQPKQAVEAHEVADMSMRYEYMLEAQEFARRQRGEVTKVDQDRALFE
jgi:hypothetical protein